MKKCTFYVNSPGASARTPVLAAGCGFRQDGAWRGQPLPEAAGLLVDDRFLPDRRGLAAALRSLAQWQGLLVFDFERPRHPLLAELIAGLGEKELAVPPAYGELPHTAVLVGPWPGGGSFDVWISACRERYGALILDGAPLRCRAAPGCAWTPWEGPLPAQGFFCRGLGAMHRRMEDGAILFWDTRETLTDRYRQGELPVILFLEDWERLPETKDRDRPSEKALDFYGRD